jgi:4-amino-4-deoxy-L-arabinose transferase-like glycosyltransferase
VQGIVHDQQWILPYRNGELPSKPPLFHWLAAAASLIFGESDFSTRLPSAIGAGVMVIVTFLLGRAMAGKLTGWLAVGALLGTYDFWHAAGQARVDMVFSACVTVAIAGFYFWYRDGTSAARASCYSATIGAVLAKGPLGLALVGFVILGFLVVDKRLRLLRSFWSWPLVGVAVIGIGGWYGLAYAIGGDKFLALQIGYENVARLVGGDAFPRRRIYLTMAVWLATRTLPWNLAVLWSVFRWRRGMHENSDGYLIHVWWIAMFSFFALAAHGRPVYFLPLTPAIALLAARALRSAISQATAANINGRTELSAPAGVVRGRSLVTWIATGVVLCDLIVMFVNYGSWLKDRQIKASLAFQKKLGAEVAADTVLFAAPGLDADDVMVLAYRLKREIDRRPFVCAKRNDYFLTAMGEAAVGQAQVLASLDSSKIALVRVLDTRHPLDRAICQEQTTPVADRGNY